MHVHTFHTYMYVNNVSCFPFNTRCHLQITICKHVKYKFHFSVLRKIPLLVAYRFDFSTIWGPVLSKLSHIAVLSWDPVSYQCPGFLSFFLISLENTTVKRTACYDPSSQCISLDFGLAALFGQGTPSSGSASLCGPRSQVLLQRPTEPTHFIHMITLLSPTPLHEPGTAWHLNLEWQPEFYIWIQLNLNSKTKYTPRNENQALFFWSATCQIEVRVIK